MNSTADWEQVKEVFSSVLEIEPERRSDFLDERCGDDDILRSEVESWLASHTESEGFIETPVFSANSIIDQPTPMAGRQFGNYRIIHEIGHGGMGAVYLAQRTDGEFEQEVALKIVRQSIAESQMIERFRRERQILASLNHPNIAKLLDGGVSERRAIYRNGICRRQHNCRICHGIIAVTKRNTRRCFLRSARQSLTLTEIWSSIAISSPEISSSRTMANLNCRFWPCPARRHEVSDQTNQKTAFRALTPAYASPEQLRGERSLPRPTFTALVLCFSNSFPATDRSNSKAKI